MFSSVTRHALTSAARCSPLRTPNYMPRRGIIQLADVKYTAHAKAKGAGRNGEVESGSLELDLALPKELGGTGKGQNPEQLFAMGYAACLLGAIQAVAKSQGKTEMAKKAVVHASVKIGTPTELKGFGLAVDIKVAGVDDELLQAGHEFCPYSRMLKYGGGVTVSKA